MLLHQLWERDRTLGGWQREHWRRFPYFRRHTDAAAQLSLCENLWLLPLNLMLHLFVLQRHGNASVESSDGRRPGK